MMLASDTQLELAIAPDILAQTWQQSQAYATPRSQWTAFLNQLCLDTLFPWLQAESLPQARLHRQAWELVNGTAIECDRQRFIFIPDKSADTRQITVPQEWIDLPDWAGDYYFAIHLDPDASTLRLWGYTTHAQLKTQGEYDDFDRTYSLAAPSLISDLAVLWVVRQLNPHEVTQAAIAPIPQVPAAQAENLLTRLASADIHQPRLELPFSLWGGLLSSGAWCDRLIRSRQQGTPAPTPLITQLSQWFQNAVEEIIEGWQTLDQRVMPELATSLRQASAEGDRPTQRRVKTLHFGQQPLLLILAITPVDEKISIQIQLRPEENTACLPPNLHLSLQTMNDDVIQSVQTGDRYNSIQLSPFKCRPGTGFKVKVGEQNLEQAEGWIEECFQC
ncbi:MAG: DUF1822 family protein [Oculatellaceae cyanobacterium Prado106]|nr:DUF1822 family protein [Oculatellaceae cyanobacterium Prado106]